MHDYPAAWGSVMERDSCEEQHIADIGTTDGSEVSEATGAVAALLVWSEAGGVANGHSAGERMQTGGETRCVSKGKRLLPLPCNECRKCPHSLRCTGTTEINCPPLPQAEMVVWWP